MVARMLRSAHADEQRVTRKLSSIDEQLNRLEGLVNTLFDVSRIVAGRLEVQRQTVDLGEIAANAVEQFDDLAERTGSELVLSAARVVGRWDHLRLDQVLTNLVGNALKFAPGKPVEITVSERNGQAVLVVRDHGPGISPESQARIFERFERAAESRTFGGLGLGLWITRQIVEAHGGTITVESAPGRGTSFTVVLPKSAA
jgi:signal transduction histidine kinase